jgi:magnesium transporter
MALPRIVPKELDPVHHLKVVGRFVRRALKKPGLPPGTVVHTGAKKEERARVSYIDYDAQHLTEREDVQDLSVLWGLCDSPSISWVNVDGLHDTALVERIGERFGIHPLVLEDIVHVGQRPKVEEYDEYLYVVLYQLEWQGEEEMVAEEQVSLVIGPNFVFSFQERQGDDFATIRERLRTGKGKLRERGSDYLAYALIDATVDNYFSILDQIGRVTEQVELELLEQPSQDTMRKLQQIKREMLVVRRTIWPLREVMASLMRSESELISEDTKVYLRDVHDHSVQVLEAVETLRDVVSGMIDLYLSQVAQRTNEAIRVLTVMASIFIPLTFIVGVYGMNFDYMPELQSRWGYPVVWAVMISTAAGLLLWFKKRDWI